MISKSNVFAKLFALLSIYFFEYSDENESLRQTKFKVIKNSSGGNVCSTEIPYYQVISKVRSKVECTLRCLDSPFCHGVNWNKETYTCEIYLHHPSAFGIKTGCTYYSTGKWNMYCFVSPFTVRSSTQIRTGISSSLLKQLETVSRNYLLPFDSERKLYIYTLESGDSSENLSPLTMIDL